MRVKCRSGDVSALTMRHHPSIEDQTLGKLTSCDDDFTCLISPSFIRSSVRIVLPSCLNINEAPVYRVLNYSYADCYFLVACTFVWVLDYFYSFAVFFILSTHPIDF